MLKIFMISISLFVFALTPSLAQSLSITNKSVYPVIVIVKKEDFSELVTLQVSPESTEYYMSPAEYKGLLHLESYLQDPKDPTRQPVFFHNVKTAERVCLPRELCMKKVKKGWFSR